MLFGCPQAIDTATIGAAKGGGGVGIRDEPLEEKVGVGQASAKLAQSLRRGEWGRKEYARWTLFFGAFTSRFPWVSILRSKVYAYFRFLA